MKQSSLILDHLKTHGSITPKEALDRYGCMRLGARIYDLRQMGVEISKTMEEGVNRLGHPTRYARYSMRRTEK